MKRKKNHSFVGKALSVGLFAVVLLAAGCDNGGDEEETLWLKDLANPFIGEWQSEIPSTGNQTVKFNFKQDGTFECTFPAGPNTMTATGGYLVKGNVQVTFLSYDDGVGGYTFEVVDNNTIKVTEIASVNEATGAITPGNTAAFTRVPGSAVNKENKPFTVNHALINKTWKEIATPYQAEYAYNPDGTGTMQFTQGEQRRSFDIAYFAFHDQGLNKDVLVTFIPPMNAFTPYSYTLNGNTITVQEITEVSMGAQGPSAGYGEAITFFTGSELSLWAGTWNAIDQYLDDPAMNSVWTNAVAAIIAAEPAAQVNAAMLKTMFKAMLRTDFKSCVISGNTMQIYHVPDAAGSPAGTITYAYSGIHTVEREEGIQNWFKFTGDAAAGQFKYLVLGPTHQDAPDSMLHFHLQYSAKSFEAATGDDPNWVATVTPSATTIEQIAEDLAEFPWAAFAFMFVPTS